MHRRTDAVPVNITDGIADRITDGLADFIADCITLGTALICTDWTANMHWVRCAG
jgi:hypothetical protein